MTGMKRKALLGAAMAVVGMAAMIPAIVSGTASAQSGSRLCGRVYSASTTHEQVIRLYETEKGDKPFPFVPAIVCTAQATSDFRLFVDAPFPLVERDPKNWTDKAFEFEKCEDLKSNFLGGREWEFIGGGWPEHQNYSNICHNMNRSDHPDDLQRYWLYAKNDVSTWQFTRG